MVTPYFKMFWANSIPKYVHTDEAGKTTNVEIIAGNLAENKCTYTAT